MAKQQHKSTTLGDLAAIMNQGFTTMQKHMDEQLDALRGEMSGMKGTMKDMLEELNATHADVRYLRRSVDTLVRHDAAHDAAIKTLTARVVRLEKAVADHQGRRQDLGGWSRPMTILPLIEGGCDTPS